MARWKKFDIIEVESLLAARGGANSASSNRHAILEQVRGGAAAAHVPSQFKHLAFVGRGPGGSRKA